MSIRVITHNGKPPAEGGLRLGYLVGDLFFPWGTSSCLTREQACAMFIPPRPAATKPAVLKKTVPPIIFSELWPALDTSYRCPHCFSPNNPAVKTLTDEGQQRVGICGKCDALFQAWQSIEERKNFLYKLFAIGPSNQLLPPEPAKETFRISRFGANDDREIPSSLLKRPTPKKTAKSRKTNVTAFSKLPRALSHQQECYYCNHEPNTVQRIETDEGIKMLVKCGCGQIMRPFAKKG